jgi:hypothetical protein
MMRLVEKTLPQKDPLVFIKDPGILDRRREETSYLGIRVQCLFNEDLWRRPARMRAAVTMAIQRTCPMLRMPRTRPN